jgi:hypothetical protein
VNGLHPLLGKRVVVTDQDTGQRTTGTLHGLRQAASTSLVQRNEWVLLNDEADRIELRGNLTIEAEDEPNT